MAQAASARFLTTRITPARSIHISQGTNISNATYAIDTTNAGSGRGTLTFTDSAGGTFQYVFYLASPTSGVIQDVSSGFVADGTLFAQTGSPFTLAGLAGNYAFNWSGVGLSSLKRRELRWAICLGQRRQQQHLRRPGWHLSRVNGVASFPNSGIQGTLTINSDGSTNNTYQIMAGNSVASTYGSRPTSLMPTRCMLVGTDQHRVLAGFASRQSQ